jgi:uncharacterized protein YndB with AHSA1/START domain
MRHRALMMADGSAQRRSWPRASSCSDKEEVTERSIDLRVGGSYHFVFVTDDGTECSFRGTFLEVERPTRTVQTWLFDRWPDAEAVEPMDLHEADGVTKLTHRLAFRDKAGHDHMTKYDGLLANFDNEEDYLRSLLDPEGKFLGNCDSRQAF